MELPPIPFEIPNIASYLPVEIPTLIHPAIVHFVIALPVVILLLEIMNIFMGKKAIGGVNFFLLFLVVITSVGAYLTGLVDGKEASVVDEAIKSELLEHKLLGTWLMLLSGVVFLFKLLSVITQNGVIKMFYMIILIGFVLGILNQGKEGGELVYSHGLNVDTVKEMDDTIFELNDEIEDLKEKLLNQMALKKETKEVVVPEVVEEEVSTELNVSNKESDEVSTVIETVVTP